MSSRIEQLDAEHMRFAESAWHKLGTVGEIDYIESLSALDWADAHLDSPWFYFDDPTEGRHPDLGESGGLVQDPDTKTVVLNNYPYTHGYHSNRYKLVQHSFLTRELLPKLIQYGLVKSIESIGTYGSGEAAFVSVRLPNDIEIDGYSEVHNVINLTNGYDKLPLSLTNSLGIVVCANTMQTNVLNVPAWHTFKHIGMPAELMNEAVNQLGLRVDMGSGHGSRIERLLNQELVDAEFQKIVRAVIGEQPNKFTVKQSGPAVRRAWTEWNNKRDRIMYRYTEDPNNTNITGTAWGALMAVQAYEQKDLRVSKASGSTQERHHRNLVMGKLPLTEKAVKALGIGSRLASVAY